MLIINDFILLKFCMLFCCIFDNLELEWVHFWCVKPLCIGVQGLPISSLLDIKSNIRSFLVDWIDYGLYIAAMGICRLFDLLQLAFLIQLLTISCILSTIGFLLYRLCCFIDEDMCKKSHIFLMKIKSDCI